MVEILETSSKSTQLCADGKRRSSKLEKDRAVTKSCTDTDENCMDIPFN